MGVYDGYTRVALSLPPDATYRVAVFDATMVITLPGGRADAGALSGESAQVKSLRYSSVDGTLALVIGTTYPLGADGTRLPGGLFSRRRDQVTGAALYRLRPRLAGSERDGTPPGSRRKRRGWGRWPEKVAEKPAARPKVVVLDPGHGGKWAGARNAADTVQEEVVVLAIAYKVKGLLERSGVEVVMTRTANVQLSNNYDGDLVAPRGASPPPPRNVFVSIHANAGPASAHGIETFVYGQPLDEATLQAAIRENGGGAVGRAVTQDVLATVSTMQGDLVAQETLKFSRALAESVQFHLVSETGARDRGVKQAPYRVLTQARIPAILIETGFVSHPEEGSNLTSEAYQNRLAEGIAAGILGFFDTNGSVAAR